MRFRTGRQGTAQTDFRSTAQRPPETCRTGITAESRIEGTLETPSGSEADADPAQTFGGASVRAVRGRVHNPVRFVSYSKPVAQGRGPPRSLEGQHQRLGRSFSFADRTTDSF